MLEIAFFGGQMAKSSPQCTAVYVLLQIRVLLLAYLMQNQDEFRF